MNPHIRHVLRGNAVSPPFVSAFMHNDEIEFHSYGRTRSTNIPIDKSIPVRNGALMFHPVMRTFDKFVPIPYERVFSEILLECSEHWLHVRRELLFRLF